MLRLISGVVIRMCVSMMVSIIIIGEKLSMFIISLLCSGCSSGLIMVLARCSIGWCGFICSMFSSD